MESFFVSGTHIVARIKPRSKLDASDAKAELKKRGLKLESMKLEERPRAAAAYDARITGVG